LKQPLNGKVHTKEQSMFQISSLDHIALTVSDQARSLEWYRRVLGMEQQHAEAKGVGDPVFVCAGNACLALFPAQIPDPLPVPGQNVLSMRHFAFRLRWTSGRSRFLSDLRIIR
jgi:catechol 2,3-dioxygenase-like lactoylglutathione lyase family enzyme